MKKSRSLICITLADLIVRSAYQMGKTPLLPIFALTLGATDAYLGFIVSVSTLTGMVFKPFIGILSDRWGRRGWLLFGTAFFTIMPFVYRFISTPDQLFAVRIIHGLATAIYGPVTLAYVAEQSQKNLAERLGWFSMARNASHIIGPATAGWLLLSLKPVSVFTIIAILSSIAFLPILLLPKSTLPETKQQQSLIKQALHKLKACSKIPAIWFAGGLEAVMCVALYAVKAFLPIYALSIGINMALVGSFFAIQEGTHLFLKPLCGRLGDRMGNLRTVSIGMIVLGATLPLVIYTANQIVLFVPALLLGVSQALISTSTLALVSTHVSPSNLGTGMGLIGTLRNAGKVLGPMLTGLLIRWFGYNITFHLIGSVVVLAVLLMMRKTIHTGRRNPTNIYFYALNEIKSIGR